MKNQLPLITGSLAALHLDDVCRAVFGLARDLIRFYPVFDSRTR